MTLDSKNLACTLPGSTCSKCGAATTKDRDTELNDILQVLEIVPTRADAPNAHVCRAILKNTFGSKRGRYLIDRFLEDKVVPGTKAYNRRHIMMIDRRPLRRQQVILETLLTSE